MAIKINETVAFPDGEPIASGSFLENRAVSAERINKGKTTAAIVAVDTTAKKFEIDTDLAEKFKDGAKFEVKDSTGKDGTYTVSGDSVYNATSTNTEITVVEAIANATIDGNIEYDDLTWVLRASELWWRSQKYCNEVAGNPDNKKDEPVDTSALKKQFDITESELAGDLENLYSTKKKAELDTVYTASNVVIV